MNLRADIHTGLQQGDMDYVLTGKAMNIDYFECFLGCLKLLADCIWGQLDSLKAFYLER